MTSKAERIEVLVDPVARSWVPDPAGAGETVRQRCVVYVALPQQKMMGKVGGEPPRPVRWRSGDEEDNDNAPAAAGVAVPASSSGIVAPTSSSDVAPACGVPAEASDAAAEGHAPGQLPTAEVGALAEAASEDRELSEPLPAAEDPEQSSSAEAADFPEEDDPLTFTAKPADGVVIHSAVFERLQHGVSERHAGHRYAGQALAS